MMAQNLFINKTKKRDNNQERYTLSEKLTVDVLQTVSVTIV